jgi:hypothetical protein
MKRWIIGAAIILLLVAGGLWVRQFFQVDNCLDSGGRWNYDESVCEH